MSTPASSSILQVHPLGFPWPTIDPFLFCAYHDDAYPRANAQMAPDAPVQGRQIGSDFSRKDGWSLYHGHPVPGFPGHPHRGFETVTVVRQGLIDHADSLGAAARYGQGDVQWLTAGAGIQHAEMFPLLNQEQDNPLELFQIWLNLPARRKMATPHFTMFWADEVPQWHGTDAQGRRTDVRVVAGRLAPVDGGPGVSQPLAPPPDSWAAQADAEVAIWTVRLEAGAQWTLPAAAGADTRRMLYLFRGEALQLDDQQVRGPAAIELRAGQAVALTAGGDAPVELLLLQGRPIGEPVAQYGPFVMNTQAEIVQAMQDYRRTQFGGWPWADDAPVHGRDPQRFARHPDGREERPEPAAAGR
ncbi:pirin family protein [Xenophilus arseniciresistens]|uniref:Pirin family protein n=1 Tax=Xenophilus arseniciresistens TaxID=1283306 RepID=A0AAE3NDP9_9BURK|nr:pirin family protein [Xenophilus arseniciresistens]MDA7419169.1 pirin family protein [Xenophilus arseniciresistens]